MWLQLDFGDSEFERALVEHIRKLLARRYTPLSRVKVSTHC